MTPARRLRYIEFDGQVYLVQKNGQRTFPEENDPLPFEVEERHSTMVLGTEVAFCRARLRRFPTEWTYKDDVPHMADVDPVVRQSINASLARCVVGVIALDAKDQILMVKSSRGFTVGMWNIPGGFIEYGEHPEQAAVRETLEETGVQIELGPLLGVYKERFQSPYFMYGFMYEARATSTGIRIDPTEIQEAAWMPPEQAFSSTRNPFARQAFQRRFPRLVPAGRI